MAKYVRKGLFLKPTMKDIIQARNRGNYGFNKHAHTVNHKHTITTYTSITTLDTVASTPFYMPFSARLAWVEASVSAAPTSTMKIDVLFGGDSIFDGSNFIEIENGDVYGKGLPGRMANVIGLEQTGVANATKIQVQINTVAAATGPMVVYFFWDVEA